MNIRCLKVFLEAKWQTYTGHVSCTPPRTETLKARKFCWVMFDPKFDLKKRLKRFSCFFFRGENELAFYFQSFLYEVMLTLFVVEEHFEFFA